MPANEIMADFRAGTLHSGRGGPIVTKKKQAKAIQLAYLRREGHDIPEKRGIHHTYARLKHGSD